MDRVYCYYPFDQEHQIRTSDDNDRYAKLAQKLNKNAKCNVGVKGRSAFSMLVKGLPLSVGIDYMHCILLGVLSRCSQTTKKKSLKFLKVHN